MPTRSTFMFGPPMSECALRHSGHAAHAAPEAPCVARHLVELDVRCDCERRRHDLKNPSTSVDAQSRALHGTMGAYAPLAGARAASGRPFSARVNRPGPVFTR